MAHASKYEKEPRPANMRLTHGLRYPHVDYLNRVGMPYSVASVECVEDLLIDSWYARESGAGMDAPPELPIGSVKAFFTDTNGNKQYNVAFGFCQRTVTRKGG